MKIIEEFEKWLILKYALKEKGYKPCQYQYGAENENGFHVWFWKCNRLNVEVVTHGCLSDNPLEGYLKLHPEIRNIKFALDNDFNAKFSNGSPAPNWRQQAAEKLADKYMQLGYTTSIDQPIAKDWNEELMNMYMVQKYLQNRPEEQKQQEMATNAEELDEAM